MRTGYNFVEVHMKLRSVMLLATVVAALLPGCSKKVVRMRSPSVSRPHNETRELQKRRTFTSGDASGYGYLDNLQVPAAQQPKMEAMADGDAAYYESPVQQALPQVPMSVGKSGVQYTGKPGTGRKMKRMVTYDGRIVCRSLRPDSLVELAVALGQSLGGYVEARNMYSVVLRVPVARFGTLYDSLLSIGDVIDFLKTAEDITDAFRDTDLRITVLEKTIERYVRLVQLVKEEKDKIALLKEIERLREELEVLRVQKSVLSLRAEFAKLEYSVEQISTGFASFGAHQPVAGLEWISLLDPINSYRMGQRYDMTVPDGMVRIHDRNFWMVQSPAGSRIWTSLMPDVPQGTSDFWINAVAFALADQFPVVDTSSAAGFRFVHCTPHPGLNYRYSVAVRVEGKRVAVVQLYFPDEAQKERYFGAVVKALSGAGGAS